MRKGKKCITAPCATSTEPGNDAAGKGGVTNAKAEYLWVRVEKILPVYVQLEFAVYNILRKQRRVIFNVV